MVKEAIFNMVAGAAVGAAVVDLFAGSGALGIEALSRGAARATFVDHDEAAVRVIRRNLESLGFTDRAQVVRADVTRWLPGHAAVLAACSLVLLDPPYNDAVLDQVLILLDALVAPGAIVVAEHAYRQHLPPLSRLRSDRERRYGDTAVSVLVAG